jgi:ADP-ribose pyrophosphatase
MQEREIDRKRVFDGKLLHVDVVGVELPDGKHSVREIVRHPGAAVILCRRPDDSFVLVRQFRMAAKQALLEVVAGTLEEGEDPAACARREVLEETGYEVTRLVPLGTAYPAPGYTEELLHFFFADIPQKGGMQSPDDDEQVEVACFSREKIENMIAVGEMRDAKTLSAWLLYTRSPACQGGE